DFTARKGEELVDRKAVLAALTSFLKANNLKADWQGIENAPNEALVNALAMMSPYDPAEKQAMLEAPDLKTPAEILVAVTETTHPSRHAGATRPYHSPPPPCPAGKPGKWKPAGLNATQETWITVSSE